MSAAPSPHLPRRLACALVAAAGLLAACATTGDPNKGGLFGWSENKAKARQAQLSSSEAAQRQQAAAAQQRGDTLRQRQATLGGEALQLQAELDALRAENRRLDAQLRTLMHKHQLGAHEMQRLNSLLAENQRLLSKYLAAAADEGADPTADALELYDQNSRLHRELLALLHR
jgi:septal ring factor EnvC (AmiA/AmiB activator)